MPTSHNSGARAAKRSGRGTDGKKDSPPAAGRTPGMLPSSHPARPARWPLAAAGGAVLAALVFFQVGRSQPKPTPPLAPAARAGGVQAAQRPAFSGASAFALLKRQVAFGPRVPNRASHRKCRDYLAATLRPLADSVAVQSFSQTVDGSVLRMSNIIARWKGAGGAADPQRGVLLCAHWDTRPTADFEQDPRRRRMPIPGANDGASGVAVLMEAARIFKQAAPPVPVTIVFFDGEDYGPGLENMFLGSRYFADHLPEGCPRRGILLDMIGDRDLEIPQEGHSVQHAREVVQEVYEIAQRLGLERHFPQRGGGQIEDDHVPLLAKGLKVIDLIDFSYGPNHSWWHTLADTPDKCSPASLKAVGDVVVEWVYTRG
jgi:peptidase M28-like protein